MTSAHQHERAEPGREQIGDRVDAVTAHVGGDDHRGQQTDPHAHEVGLRRRIIPPRTAPRSALKIRISA
ncbi:hypothetical protein ACWEOZ_27575 [Actinoplanes sp. NPDC004185]